MCPKTLLFALSSSSSVFDTKMLLLARLLHTHPIRRFSSSRDFFANLKKYYRSTTSDLYMASDRSPSQTCFVFDKDEGTKILIQMTYSIPLTSVRRKFNLLRSADETVSQTVRRLTANIDRAAKKESKSIKRRQTDGASQPPSEAIVIQLFDDANQPIDEVKVRTTERCSNQSKSKRSSRWNLSRISRRSKTTFSSACNT